MSESRQLHPGMRVDASSGGSMFRFVWGRADKPRRHPVPLGLSVVVHAPHGRDNPGVSSERARVCGPQWAALGFSTVAMAPGVLPNKREPLGTAVGVTPGTFCCCSCPSLEGQSGSFGGVCASIWCPMGGSWLQHRVRHPRRAAQQAEATQRGRRGRPIYFLLLFMPLIG